MTHLSGDLERICRCWCPVIGQCPAQHYCKDMEEIKRRIMHIAAYEQESFDE